MSGIYGLGPDIKHRDGIEWADAPIPPEKHRCFVQTSGWIGLNQWLRCACGAIAEGIDLKPYEKRDVSDDRWNAMWMERNTREGPTTGDHSGDYSGTFAGPYDWQREDARQAVRDAHRPLWPRIVHWVFVSMTAALILGTGYVLGVQVTEDNTVCHSSTEDSVLYDCNYDGSDNGWHPED